jgi:hypothetical protein
MDANGAERSDDGVTARCTARRGAIDSLPRSLVTARSEQYYRGWRIRITLTEIRTDSWSATTEVWRPGLDPDTISGRVVPLVGRFASQAVAVAAAAEAAIVWIDRHAD